MLWTILIASVYTRHAQLVSLLERLDPQLGYCDDQVRILVDRDDGHTPVGHKRTRLVEAAAGSDYISFIDDDDQVADWYAGAIYAALATGPDYVGFAVEYTVDGVGQKPVYHSLRYPRWSEDSHAFYRGISHLNPIRRDAAVLGLPFEPGFGEDRAWSERVAATGLVTREVYIPACLYAYRFSSAGSLFRHGPRSTGRPAPTLPLFQHVEELHG